jgi:transcriptional regulator with XRE-family HTH domain
MSAQVHDNSVIEEPDQLHILGNNITLMREAMALTCGQLGDYVGTSTSNISKLERAKTENPSYFIISKLARLFGVTSEQLTSRNISSICDRERATRRMKDNFGYDEWAVVVAQVDVLTKLQASDGRFRRRVIK